MHTSITIDDPLTSHVPSPLASSLSWSSLPACVGVSAAFINTFLAKHGSRIARLTTAEAFERVVRPSTEVHRCAYWQLTHQRYDDIGNVLHGPANVYVSHPWGGKIVDSLSVLLEYAESHPTSLFYVDLFSDNQHANSTIGDTALRRMHDKITALGRVVAVLSPLSAPHVLYRRWGLLEWCMSLTSAVQFDVIAPPAQLKEFKDCMIKYSRPLHKSINDVSFEKTVCFRDADRAPLLAAFLLLGHTDDVIQLVKTTIRAWYVATAQAIGSSADESLEGKPPTPAIGNMLGRVAFLMNAFGEYARAIDYYEKSLRVRLQVLEQDDPALATSFCNLGEAYRNAGDIDKAIDCLERCLAIELATLDHGHPSIVTSYHNLGAACLQKGDHERAQLYFEKALALASTSKLHAEAAVILCDLGALWYTCKEPSRAAECLTQALPAMEKLHGPNHIDVLLCCKRLAWALQATGQTQDAIDLLERVCSASMTVYGPKHANTTETLAELAPLYQRVGKYDQAADCYGRCLAIRSSEPAPDLSTLASLHSGLANALSALGDYDRALVEYTSELAICAKLYGGSNNLRIATCNNNMGAAFLGRGDCISALRCYLNALSITMSAVGADDQATAISHHNVGSAYLRLGRTEDAAIHLDRALAILSEEEKSM